MPVLILLYTPIIFSTNLIFILNYFLVNYLKITYFLFCKYVESKSFFLRYVWATVQEWWLNFRTQGLFPAHKCKIRMSTILKHDCVGNMFQNVFFWYKDWRNCDIGQHDRKGVRLWRIYLSKTVFWNYCKHRSWGWVSSGAFLDQLGLTWSWGRLLLLVNLKNKLGWVRI